MISGTKVTSRDLLTFTSFIVVRLNLKYLNILFFKTLLRDG